MAIPSPLLESRRRNASSSSSSQHSSNATGISRQDVKKATEARRVFVFLASTFYLIAVIFLILVIIGNTHNNGVLPQIYFYKLDLANVIPQTAENPRVIKSIARLIGLHDFYQVGLWNFCEGYHDTGISHCSNPVSLYWFNPVEILMSELLAGATIALPTQVITILDVLRLCSRIMFGFFLSGLVLSALLMFLTPLAIRSHWWSLPLGILSAIAAVLVGAGAIIGSAISVAFRVAATSQDALNIDASVGRPMFAFMWVAAVSTSICFCIHAAMGCFCTSRRDLETGRKTPHWELTREKPLGSDAHGSIVSNS